MFVVINQEMLQAAALLRNNQFLKQKKTSQNQGMASGAGKSTAFILLVLNVFLYFVVVSIAAWAVNHGIERSHHTGTVRSSSHHHQHRKKNIDLFFLCSICVVSSSQNISNILSIWEFGYWICGDFFSHSWGCGIHHLHHWNQQCLAMECSKSSCSSCFLFHFLAAYFAGNGVINAIHLDSSHCFFFFSSLSLL